MELLPKTMHQHDNSVRQEQVEKKQNEYHLVGKQRKVAGHTLYEFNLSTKEIKPADISRQVIYDIRGFEKYVNKTEVRQGCFYIQALNKKNAEKKLRKIGLL